jgi:ubiquinol-cytochrome c reductase cytochrome c subunit
MGYMPLESAFEAPKRSKPAYSDGDIRSLVAYIASFGGPGIPMPHAERGALSEGLALYTEHCAGCHQVVGEGGVVTNAVAPELSNLTPTRIAEAVRVGPYLMPAFPVSQISDRELDSIIRYISYTEDPDDRGGWGIAHIGPVTEGLVAWLIAGTALVLVAVVIGARAK